MKMPQLYEITFGQKWDQIFPKENSQGEEDTVLVDVSVQTEAVKVAGRNAFWDDKDLANGVLWFKSCGLSVGLSLALCRENEIGARKSKMGGWIKRGKGSC